MRNARGFVAAFVLAGLLSGCGGGGGGMESLPEDQKRPDAGLDAAAKLKNMAPPAANAGKSKRSR